MDYKNNPEYILIENDGPEIVSTNFWSSELAEKGYAYISTNARTIRLLVPPKMEPQITDMKTAKELIISRGPHLGLKRDDMFEFLFEDKTESPYMLIFSPGQFERLPNKADDGGDFTATIWVQGSDGESKCVCTLPCRYRVVPRLPWLKP